MCTYGLERYFHFTWTTTLLIKVWLDVIFKSLGCHQKVSLVWFGGFVWFFFHLMLFICWFNCESQPSLGCDLWVWFFFFCFTPSLSYPWLSLGILDTKDHQPSGCDTKAGWSCKQPEFQFLIDPMWSSPGPNHHPRYCQHLSGFIHPAGSTKPPSTQSFHSSSLKITRISVIYINIQVHTNPKMPVFSVGFRENLHLCLKSEICMYSFYRNFANGLCLPREIPWFSHYSLPCAHHQ